MKHIMKKTVYTAGISAEGTECRSGRECNYGDRARGGKGGAGYGAD